MTDTRPAQKLAAARERIVAEMDRLQQRVANLDTQISVLSADRTALLSKEAGLRSALEAIGPAETKGQRANGAAKAAPTTKPARKLKAAVPAPAGVAAMPANGEG